MNWCGLVCWLLIRKWSWLIVIRIFGRLLRILCCFRWLVGIVVCVFEG